MIEAFELREEVKELAKMFDELDKVRTDFENEAEHKFENEAEHKFENGVERFLGFFQDEKIKNADEKITTYLKKLNHEEVIGILTIMYTGLTHKSQTGHKLSKGEATQYYRSTFKNLLREEHAISMMTEKIGVGKFLTDGLRHLVD